MYIILIIGTILIAYGICFLKKSRNALEYKTHPISVISTSIVPVMDSAKSYHKIWYQAMIFYEFKIDGITHQSDSIGLDKRSAWFESQKNAENFIDSIKLNSICYVNNGKSFLINKLPKNRIDHYVAIIASGVILVVFFLLIKYFSQ